MIFQNTLAFARSLDQKDPLSIFKKKFHFPKHNDKKATYFCGNSLGLQPKATAKAVQTELAYWQKHGVEGWFAGETPWLSYHQKLSELAAPIVGAHPSEVIVMNTLTVNLHLMMVSFYQPTKTRFKIIMESGAFPSDQYAVESQVRFHNFDPSVAIVEIGPRTGEHCLRTEDIVQTIENQGDATALVLFGGINYYTGQFYDLEKIAAAAHRVGAKVGFDLAHAAGNVPLKLHDWQADFAVWCGYKYLNSGPGGISGAFVHDKYFEKNDPSVKTEKLPILQSQNHQSPIKRFAGWWGHDESQRFKMEKGFIPSHGAAGWQLSTVQVVPSAMHRASLEIFEKAGGIDVLRAKSVQLTAFLEFVLNESGQNFQIITPSVPSERGAQLSILTDKNGKNLFEKLTENGIIGDWREPNVIRLAPTPLYNSFEEVWRVGQILRNAL